ncbi:hypothetical protein R3P38DRAFT_3120004 [Favolaschia claudopus]|uniref:Uncharacterized protein n=1 Tax=Favolaschia claudopus TaxID=2862362 RepID=A0AAV9ZED0_9AGAR
MSSAPLSSSQPTLTPLPSTAMTPPPSPPITPARLLLHLATELLLIFTTASLLTTFLLPLFGLHATTLTVLRVTGLFTVVVFAVSEVLATVCGERSSGCETADLESGEHRTGVSGNARTLAPDFRGLRYSAAGWSREKSSGV